MSYLQQVKTESYFALVERYSLRIDVSDIYPFFFNCRLAILDKLKGNLTRNSSF